MTLTCPQPPGALGVAARPAEMLAYLSALHSWLDARRAELDALDGQIVASGRQADLTSDMTLALALWQAVKNRESLLLGTWDSGRVGQVELERLSALIWGSLDTGASAATGALNVSLPEAGKLCDVLVGQLRATLNTDPAIDAQLARLRDLRASLERIRDQVALEPPAFRPQAQAALDALAARVADASAKRQRGGDIGGLLGPLETDAATMERDLIVTSAQRRAARGLLDQVRQAREQVAAREQAVRALAVQAEASVWPCPKPAIPDVDALGPLPNTPDALRAYGTNLNALDAQLREAQRSLSGPVSAREQSAALVATLGAKAQAVGVAADPLVAALRAAADQALAVRPTVLPALDHITSALISAIDHASGATP